MSLELESRDDYLKLLESNPGYIIFKFSADWCHPCKTITPWINQLYNTIKSDEIILYEIDVDSNFDVFAFLKSKKMLTAIPTLFAYKKNNLSFAPDFSISGTNSDEIKAFFDRIFPNLYQT